MKKRLLNEASVRKMMKLANIQSLTENFLDETDEIAEEGMGSVYARDDEDPDGEMGPPMDDAPMDDAPMDDAPMDDAPMDDAPMDDEEGAPAGPTVSIDVEQLVNDIVGALNAQGADVSMDSDVPDELGVEPGPDDELDMDAEPEMELDDEAAPMMEMDDEVDEDLVAEVTRRVAQRILQTQSRPATRRSRS
jgi:hypothetical protein